MWAAAFALAPLCCLALGDSAESSCHDSDESPFLQLPRPQPRRPLSVANASSDASAVLRAQLLISGGEAAWAWWLSAEAPPWPQPPEKPHLVDPEEASLARGRAARISALALTTLLFAGSLACAGQVRLQMANDKLLSRKPRSWEGLCSRRLHAAVVPDGSLLVLPSPALELVAQGLPACDLVRLSMSSASLVRLQEFCSSELLLEEVQRLHLEEEWESSCLETPKSPRSWQESEKPLEPAQLRQFLLGHRNLQEVQEVQRQSDICRDILRCVALGVCWWCFLCQVVKLASVDKPHTVPLVTKAALSPCLFIYVLESNMGSVLRCILVGLLGVALLYDSLLRDP